MARKATVTTQAIYNSIRSEKDILVRDMGRVHLKNIKEPERIFKIYSYQEEYDKESELELTKKLIKKDIDLVDRKKEVKNAAKILSSWRKMMPFYYAAVWIILLLIIWINN